MLQPQQPAGYGAEIQKRYGTAQLGEGEEPQQLQLGPADAPTGYGAEMQKYYGSAQQAGGEPQQEAEGGAVTKAPVVQVLSLTQEELDR